MHSNATFDYVLIVMSADSTSVEMFEYSCIHQDRRRRKKGDEPERKGSQKSVMRESMTDRETGSNSLKSRQIAVCPANLIGPETTLQQRGRNHHICM